MKTLECHYPLPSPNLASVLQAAQNSLEDLAYAQVGRWRPYEVRLIVPSHLALAPDAASQAVMQDLQAWLRAQGTQWLLLGGNSAQASLRVRCMLLSKT